MIVWTRVALAVLSCVVLAWNIVLGAGAWPLWEPADVTYTVTAGADIPRNPQALSNEVWVTGAVRDGQTQSIADQTRTGSWETVSGASVHRNDPAPATIQVRGRRVGFSFLMSAWSGIARIDGGGRQWDFDLYYLKTGDQDRFLTVDFAGGRLVTRSDKWTIPPGSWPLAGVVLALLLVSFIPRRSRRPKS